MTPQEVKALMAETLDALADCSGGDNHDAAKALDLIPRLVQALDEGFADWQTRFARSSGYADEDITDLGRILWEAQMSDAKDMGVQCGPHMEWENLKASTKIRLGRIAAAVAMAVRLGSTKSEDLGRPDVVARRLRTERDHYREEVGVERDRTAYWKAKALMDEATWRGRAVRTQEFNRIKNHLSQRGIDP